jgi:hypothetical protein
LLDIYSSNLISVNLADLTSWQEITSLILVQNLLFLGTDVLSI